MNETGRIICVMQAREGASTKTGEVWKSQDFVIEIDGSYTRRILCNVYGAMNVDNAHLALGEVVTIKGEVSAHEYKGRWYNEVRVWDIIANGVSRLKKNVGQDLGTQMNVLKDS